ncbi:MAG: hypothetical protein ACI8ZM_001750 [Crocinitomix sp.]|jgi:hypothetical protein
MRQKDFLTRSIRKKKMLMTILCLFCFSTHLSAQKYTHGIGLNYNLSFFNSAYNTSQLSYTGTSQIGIPGITYKASLDFDLSENKQFSIVSYPFVGFMTNSDYGNYKGFEIPLLGELYFGNTTSSRSFIGVGATYSYLSAKTATTIIGPKIIAGFQFKIKEKTLSFNLGYALGLNKRKTSDDFNYTTDRKSLMSFSAIYFFN